MEQTSGKPASKDPSLTSQKSGHAMFIEALGQLGRVRETFSQLHELKLVSGNDNHIGDVGEYWVRRYFELNGEFKKYSPKKNSPFDIELKDGTLVAVRTMTEWSKTSSGLPVKITDKTEWRRFAAVRLDRTLFPAKICLLTIEELMGKSEFVENLARRTRAEKRTKSHPAFRWWEWLCKHEVAFKIVDGDMELSS